MAVLAFDVGGANIKIADGLGYVRTVAFAMWKHPMDLQDTLLRLIAEAPSHDRIVATMTGELADCFACKADGVAHIVAALELASAGCPLRIYAHPGMLVTPRVALDAPMRVAALNWHALAIYAKRFSPADHGLLIDIGSTTTDILPLHDGLLSGMGHTDTQRVANGSLVYTGAIRSPVCAVSRFVPYRANILPVAQEVFATMKDVYLLMGLLPEDVADCNTADARPTTKAFARARLGRMICADTGEFHHRDAATMAASIAEDQAIQVANSIRPWLGCDFDTPVVVSGGGEFVARHALKIAGHRGEVVRLAKQLGDACSHGLTAHALAVVAREKRHQAAV